MQFIWWWSQWMRPWVTYLGAYPFDGKHRGCIYSWRIRIWMLEVRKWNNKPATPSGEEKG